MYVLKWTQEALTQYGILRERAAASMANRQTHKRTKASPDEGLFKQVHKCLSLLVGNPRHPGLHTHQYHGLEHPFEAGGKVLEAYAQNQTPGAYRVFWCYGPGQNEITILTFTPHP
jgi:hypothetical protein